MIRPWISVHIFYNNTPQYLLSECIDPLIAGLRQQGLVESWFFIRYWEGGPHVRLRVLPGRDVEMRRVSEPLERSIEAYLKRRPALFDQAEKYMDPSSRRFFEFEYGADALHEKYGPDGEIPYYPNNSLAYIPYEPEFMRYGGEAGMPVAERHFEVSSDMVLGYLRSTNVHVRTILLGHAVQLMLQLVRGFLQDDRLIAPFLKRYMEVWQKAHTGDIKDVFERCSRSYAKVGGALREKVEATGLGGSSAIEYQWARHAASLRAEIDELLASGSLQFPRGIEKPADCLSYLLTSFTHMTNNRFGVTLKEEIYLAYLLHRAIEAHLKAAEPEYAVA